MSTISKNHLKDNAQLISISSILVVIDSAKAEHLVQFLEPSHGMPLLKKALNIKNNAAGMEKLLALLGKICLKNKLDYKQSTFVMEDPASYSRNFINQLQKKGFNVNYVNARQCKPYRLSSRASSDEIDLEGIGGAAMRGHMIDFQESSETYKRLIRSVRERTHLIKEQTSHENLMQTYIDELFPGFFNHDLSGIEAFTEHCFVLMLRNDFTIYRGRP